MKRTWTIGELAREAGVTVETIRYYERRGLIRRPSTGRPWRRYGEDVLQILRFAQRAQALGFALTDVEHLLRGRGAATRARALAMIAEIDGRLADLAALRKALAEAAAGPPQPRGADPIMDALVTRALRS